MSSENSTEEIAKILENNDKETFRERLKRIKFLMSLDKLYPIQGEKIPAPSGLTAYYHDEIGTCWINGADIATILLVHSAFDELLRTYCRQRQINKAKNKKLDEMDLTELVDLVLSDGLLLKREANMLHHFVIDIYQPYARLKECRIEDPSIACVSRSDPFPTAGDKQTNTEGEKGCLPSYIVQEFRVTMPFLVGKSVSDEAKEAVSVYSELTRTILCSWMMGQEGDSQSK
jgi:hypothetical protein